MSETITVRIGGEDITIPAVANFAVLKRISPSLDVFNAKLTEAIESKTLASNVDLISASCAIIAGAALRSRPDLTLPEIEDRLRVNVIDGTDERPGIIDAVMDLLRASGLIRAGEAGPAEDAAAVPSTATTNTLSPS